MSCRCWREPDISTHGLLDFHEARRLARQARPNLRTVTLPLIDAVGGVLAADITARNPSPPFDNSAVDGYALSACGQAGASYSLLAPVFAGDSAPDAPLRAGYAAKVLTGAPVPADTACVVMQEDCIAEKDTLLVQANCPAGANVRLAGEDYETGDLLAKAGSTISPAMVGLLASDGHANADVFEAPRVGLLVTGNELTDLGQPLGPGRIYDSNTPTLISALRQMGCREIRAERVEDDLDKTRDRLSELIEQCSLVITVGGLAVGERDYIPEALSQLQAVQVFSRVAIKPGKPVSLFQTGGTPVFCLPGNPVSALVMLFAFVRPALAEAMGMASYEDWTMAGNLNRITKKAGRAELVPGSLDDGNFKSVDIRGSHLLRLLSTSPVMALVEADATSVEAGREVIVVRWRWGWT